MSYGILFPANARRKPRALLKALSSSNSKAEVFTTYQPCERLVLYGWGGDIQQQAIAQHSGDYAALDLGYWDRAGLNSRQWRVSFNGFHSPQYIMSGPAPSASRWTSSGLQILPDRRVKGPVLLIGNGPKSNKVIPAGWSVKKLAAIRKAFPGRKVLYRAKPGRPLEHGVKYDGLSSGDIDRAILSSSLVVCRHSNVAVDACRLGVPVVCDDGAGAAIYPSDLSQYKNQPSLTTRIEFLHRLAWWQWSINDIQNGAFWKWMDQRFDAL